MLARERTLIMFKPVAFERKLVGTILRRFIEQGLSIGEKKFVRKPTVSTLQQHYPLEEFNNPRRPFSRDRIVDYCSRGPLLLLVMEGEDAIRKARELKGHSNPSKATPGTIRSLVDDTIEAADARGEAYRDLVHTADSFEEAERQINLWFNDRRY